MAIIRPIGTSVRRSVRRPVLRLVRGRAAQRIRWATLAIAIAWMAATVLIVAGATLGLLAPSTIGIATAAGTIVLAPLVYRRFGRLGRVDDALVVAVLAGWAATLAAISI